MKLSNKGYEFLGKEEGLRLTAYQDSVRVWTIGYGNTFYEDGTKVKQGDKITKERAMELFRSIVKRFEDAVNKTITRELNANQFDSLVSLSYNIGVAAFSKSTVAKRVNANPCDPTIRQAFEMWMFANHKSILLSRRKREADLYYS